MFPIFSYIKNIARTVRNVVIITVLVIVAFKVGDVFIDLDDIISWGCDTELCCVESGLRPYDQYGRHLFYLYTDDGESIDEVLVREGLAVAWLKDGQHMQHLSALEIQAKLADVGCLW